MEGPESFSKNLLLQNGIAVKSLVQWNNAALRAGTQWLWHWKQQSSCGTIMFGPLETFTNLFLRLKSECFGLILITVSYCLSSNEQHLLSVYTYELRKKGAEMLKTLPQLCFYDFIKNNSTLQNFGKLLLNISEFSESEHIHFFLGPSSS